MTTLRYPLKAANGGLVLSDNANAEAISQVLQTRKGERVLRNYFGTELEELTTIPSLSGVLGTLEADIRDATDEYPLASVALEGSINDNGLMVLDCYYTDDKGDDSLRVIA